MPSTQRVWLGRLTIDDEPHIELQVELPGEEIERKSTALREKLTQMFGFKFEPACPRPGQESKLALGETAELLRCGGQGVFELIARGELHPVSDEDGELFFDRVEVARVRLMALNPA
jgi:hypothetical protein